MRPQSDVIVRIAADRIAAVRASLAGAEKESGSQRRDALTQLATQLDGDANRGSDAGKVRMLADAVRNLATSPMAAAMR